MSVKPPTGAWTIFAENSAHPSGNHDNPNKAAKGGGKGAKGAKGGGEKKKKESTKLASLQYWRPGEKRRGVKGWIKELDARGWSKKKTALSAGLEAWFEAYAENYYERKVAKQAERIDDLRTQLQIEADARAAAAAAASAPSGAASQLPMLWFQRLGTPPGP